MLSTTELRYYPISLRAVQGSRNMTVRGSVPYNVASKELSNFRERLAPRCFADSIKRGDDVVATFNYNDSVVLGRTPKTLRLYDGDKSLDYEIDLDEDNSDHRNLHASISRGDINGSSFEFIVDDPKNGGEEWDDAADERGTRYTRRTIKRATLVGVNPCTQPSYNNTQVSARALSHALTFARRLFPQSNEDLRAKAARQAEQIRQDEIRDPSLRAVKLQNGVFVRDYDKERELRTAGYLNPENYI